MPSISPLKLSEMQGLEVSVELNAVNSLLKGSQTAK